MVAMVGLPMIVRCKKWEDFQEIASQANIVSFIRRQSDGIFEVNAAKDDLIASYVGEIPKIGLLFRLWLSKELKIAENKVFEGVVSTG